jgi:hypothetical protein
MKESADTPSSERSNIDFRPVTFKPLKPRTSPSVPAPVRLHRAALCTWQLGRLHMPEIFRPADDNLLP